MGLGGAAAEPVVVRRTVEVRDAGGEAVTAVDTITETHVKRGVLVRRTQRTALEHSAERVVPVSRTPALRVATSVAIAPDILATLDRSEFAYASTPTAVIGSRVGARAGSRESIAGARSGTDRFAASPALDEEVEHDAVDEASSADTSGDHRRYVPPVTPVEDRVEAVPRSSRSPKKTTSRRSTSRTSSPKSC